MHEPVGGVQFVVFEKFANAHLQQIAREIMLLLVNNLHEKSITGSHDKQKFDIGCMLFVICTHITTFHLEKMHSFSPSWMCIILSCVLKMMKLARQVVYLRL